MTTKDPLYIHCHSGRARRRVLSTIGPHPCYTAGLRYIGRGCYLVTRDEYELVRHIPGVTKMRKTDDLFPSWI